MSLSRDLKSLSTWFDAVMNGAAEFTAEGALAFSQALGQARFRAEAIERGDRDPIADSLFDGLLGADVTMIHRAGPTLVVDNTAPGGAA